MIINSIKFIEFKRDKKGYFYRNHFVGFSYAAWSKKYVIQYKMRPSNQYVLMVYHSERKPLIRSIYLLSLGVPLAYIAFLLLGFLSFLLSFLYVLGKCLYAIGKVIKAIGCLLMFKPKTARQEFRSAFCFYSRFISEIF